MAKKPTEQENQQSREEAFRDGFRYLGHFVNLQIVVNELEVCCDVITGNCDSIIGNRPGYSQYCAVALELVLFAEKKYPQYLPVGCSFRDLLMGVTLAEKKEALEGFEALKKNMGKIF